jgi:hypothetical protein
VCKSKASKVKKYWEDLYQSSLNGDATYSLTGSQCTSTVKECLGQSGIFDGGLLTLKPITFLSEISKAKNLCGSDKGKGVAVNRINIGQY